MGEIWKKQPHFTAFVPDVPLRFDRWKHSSSCASGCQIGQPDNIGGEEVLQEARTWRLLSELLSLEESFMIPYSLLPASMHRRSQQDTTLHVEESHLALPSTNGENLTQRKEVTRQGHG